MPQYVLTTKNRYLFTGIKATIVIFIVILGVSFTPILPLSDYTIYRKAVEYLVEGKNPYELPHQSSYRTPSSPASERPPQERSAHFYVYGPPPLLGILLPFSFFSFEESKRIFIGLFYLAILWCGWNAISQIWLDKCLTSFQRLVTLLVFPVGLTFLELIWGAPSWIALAGLSAAQLSWRRGNYFLTGLSLSLLFIKIHLFALALFYLLIWSASNKKFMPAVGFITGTLLLSALGLFFQPQLFTYFFALVRTDLPSHFLNITLASLIVNGANLFNDRFLFVPLLIGCAAIAYFYKTLSRHNPIVGLFGILPLSLFLSPYAWIHDYVVLIPSIYLFLGWAFRTDRVRAIVIVLILTLAAVSEKFAAYWFNFYTIDWYVVIACCYATLSLSLMLNLHQLPAEVLNAENSNG